MHKKIFFLAIMLLLAVACRKESFPKPPHLVSRDQMIDILTDIHLADAIYQTQRYTSDELNKFSETEFYYSVLHKHKVADSTFETSLIYYSSRPKDFEKIYTRVLNRLNEMEQEIAKTSQQPVNIGNNP